MKEEILNVLSMKDILNKYGIPINRQMCHCPFHKDNSPSMKVYDKSFYCFSCNRTGDLIEFVKQYFNLNFQEAMEKINFDFRLGLKTRGRVDKKRLLEIQREHEIKLQQEKIKNKMLDDKLITACKRIIIYEKVIDRLKEETTVENWEDNVGAIAFLQEKIELIDMCFEDLLKKKILEK